jgi:hypothetical protein
MRTEGEDMERARASDCCRPNACAGGKRKERERGEEEERERRALVGVRCTVFVFFARKEHR